MTRSVSLPRRELEGKAGVSGEVSGDDDKVLTRGAVKGAEKYVDALGIFRAAEERAWAEGEEEGVVAEEGCWF